MKRDCIESSAWRVEIGIIAEISAGRRLDDCLRPTRVPCGYDLLLMFLSYEMNLHLSNGRKAKDIFTNNVHCV